MTPARLLTGAIRGEMMSDFVKYQAMGNDYLLIDPRHTDLPIGPAAVRRLCDRRFGVGADGVLHGPIGRVGAGAPVTLETFNSDGTACARSANGVRMFALHLAAEGLQGGTFVVRTAAGDTLVRVTDVDSGLVSAAMGRPRLTGPVTLAVDRATFTATCLDNGNPHAVIFGEEVSADSTRRFGPAIAGHPRFPQRTNVQFVQVIDRGALRIEVWERGAGYTTASGASACAAASAAHAAGGVDREVNVRMAGGQVDVLIDEDGAVTMSGVVEPVARGNIAPALRARLGSAG